MGELTVNKHFVFEHETYWTQQGCDCCEPDEWDVYTCISHDLPYTASSECDMFYTILHDVDYHKYHELNERDATYNELADYLSDLGITWEIISTSA